jgi:hypothetical protein
MAVRMEYLIRRYLSSAIDGAEIERYERIQSLKRLAEYSARIFNTNEK